MNKLEQQINNGRDEITPSLLDDFTKDLEKLNFLLWYSKATPEDLAMARKNSAERLNEMMKKYEYDLKLMENFNALAATPPALMFPVDRAEMLRYEFEK